MKRTALLGALLVAVIAGSLAFSTPKPLHALLCCDGAVYSTSQWWASAPTCAEAQAAFRALALPEAQADCGGATQVCAFTIPPCEDWYYMDPVNRWKIDGTAGYGCKYQCTINP
ncbi:MAG TPA: hypothetical protein VF789_01450 [Thermoanaerobaculia bacterium]